MTVLSSNVVGMSSNVVESFFHRRKQRRGFSLISWQAQYLVSLKGDFTCSAHCKFTCHM